MESLVQQLVGLERRTTRVGTDSIDHSPSGHDDLANTAAGAADFALDHFDPPTARIGTYGPGYIKMLRRVNLAKAGERDPERLCEAMMKEFRPAAGVDDGFSWCACLRHIRHFIPLLIQHLDREASILTGLRKLFGNPGGMSPRRFCARKFLSIFIFDHAAV